jgi:hypothetical protein
MSARALVAGSIVAALTLVLTSLALGGAAYEPREVQDPCQPRAWRAASGIDEIAQQLTLSALDGAACELGVSRETLTLALASADGRRLFASDPRLEDALRAGLDRGIDDAERAGAIPGVVADGLHAIVRHLPVDELIASVRDGGALLDKAQGVLSELGALFG